jgi:OOP family OmpA-OmpF porin
MKICTAVSAGLILLSCGAIGQDNPWNISGFASYLDPDSDRRAVFKTITLGLEDDLGFAAALGYRFDSKWAVRGIFNQWDFNHTANGYGLDALYHFNDEQFYGIAGYKHADISGGDDEILNLGLGKRFAINDKLFFTAEALVNQSLKDSFNDFGVNLGLTYFFGSKAHTPVKQAPVVKAPTIRVDSDGDGVYDDEDNCPNTPMVDAVDGNGCSRYAMEDESVRLSINFANNDDKVMRHYYGEIERVAHFLTKYPDSNVVIEGHTSAKGSEAYNQQLSERRAKMVAGILVSHFGVNASRVSHVGYGEERLLDNADTPTADQQNRRIEAKISGSKRVTIKR